MSGSQGSPRLGRCKISARVLKVGTKQQFTTNLFLPINSDKKEVVDISLKINKKYPDLDLVIVRLRILSHRPKIKAERVI